MENKELVVNNNENQTGLMIQLSSNLEEKGIKLTPIKLYNLISSPNYKVKDITNNEFKILDFITLPEQSFKDEKTGEETISSQTIYFIQNSNQEVCTISSYSSTLLKSFQRIKSMLGFDIMVKIVSDTTKQNDEVIQYYNVIPIESGVKSAK